MIYDKRNATYVLGALFLQPDLLADTDKYMIGIDDFADRIHKITFSSIHNMYFSGITSFTINEFENYLQKYPEIYESFSRGKGAEMLLSAIEVVEIDNFQFYYDRLKKMSLLRDLKPFFDISEWYAEDMYDIGERQKLEEKLEQASVQDIIQSITEKITNIESKYVNRQSFSFASAETGILKLIAERKKAPEIGLSFQGNLFSTLSRGARKTKFYLTSARSGTGKSRFAAGQAAHLSYPIRWNANKHDWEVTGHVAKTLLITTELQFEEVQTMLLAHVAGVNEDKILNGTTDESEDNRIQIAAQIMLYYADNLFIYHMPDPNVTQINSNIRRWVIAHQIDMVFMDYIHTSAQLLAEFGGFRVREDVALLLMATALKNLANELNVFIWSATQVNAHEADMEFADESCIRGSRALADKSDIGGVMRPVSPDHLKTIKPIVDKVGIQPNLFMDIYKNRGSQLSRVKLWMQVDLGTCRFQDAFLTNEYGEYIETDVIKAAPEQKVPTIDEILQGKEVPIVKDDIFNFTI